jgi:hypothetical protein
MLLVGITMTNKKLGKTYIPDKVYASSGKRTLPQVSPPSINKI